MWAWLLPLASFIVIAVGYSLPQLAGVRVSYAQQKLGAYISIAAIVKASRPPKTPNTRQSITIRRPITWPTIGTTWASLASCGCRLATTLIRSP
jgi:hypothetical protein